MTEFDTSTNNTAERGATVGIQADEVHNSPVYHNSTVYMTPPDASPRENYEVAVSYLEGGVPTVARDLIGQAIAHGYDGSEVRFHGVLAMLSKRAYRDLTTAEREQLGHTSQILRSFADDEWTRALEAIFGLLDCMNAPEGDSALALKKLLALHHRQRDKIVHHLDLVLAGGTKDSLWAETRKLAEDQRCSGDRPGGLWAYFHPAPIGPRARQPAENSTTPSDRIRTIIWSGLFVVAVGYLGWSVLLHAMPLPALTYLLMLAAGFIGARNGLEWRYRAKRLEVKDRAYFGQRVVNRAPEAGFANAVDHSFTHYVTKYAPQGADRTAWLADTTGIRRTLRDEIVELYRESRTKVDQVNWLIRHLVIDVRDRWKSGTLLDYREHYRTPPSTKVWCALSLAALVPAAVGVIVTATRIDPLPAASATLLALVSGRFAATRWLRIISERRRFAEDHRDYERLMEDRSKAYTRWRDKLVSMRPSETQMETWLNSDKTSVLDEALRHYHLAWRDIIAHAFLQTPARGCKRAQVQRGPWRYSKYNIWLFLITEDGVREVRTELDFEHTLLNGRERTNYRFDAVSSVHVAKTGELGYTLGLTLTNGPTRNIRISDPQMRSDPGENPSTFTGIDLDGTGFRHTLNILEGIAADGKDWINRDPNTGSNPPRATGDR